ncbi:MAG TPA: hypothetical protein VFV70_00600 [Hyphomonadaceae bacterium]|nr:hypothetical protein [Hyphomonadaceae bacterium]
MTLARNCITVAAALGFVLVAPSGALAQSAKGKSVMAKPAASSAAATSWTCVSRANVEIAPVSFDTAGEPATWVVVHRIDGEVIAAERVGAVEVQKLRRLPCGTPDSDLGGVARVG